MDRRILIGIGILVLVVLGFMLVSNMTGNVITGGMITGAVVGSVEEMKVEGESFRISDFGSDEVNDMEADASRGDRE